MATFNAGSIDATLTLDRTSFTRELRNARAQAQRFEQRGIHVELELDSATALGELAAFQSLLDDETVNIAVDVDGLGPAVTELAALQAQVEALDGRDVDIDVDVHERGLGGSGGRGLTGTVTRMEAIIAGILLLAPLIPAAVAPATAAVAGLASSLTAAAGGVGVLALGVGGTVKNMADASKELQKAKDELGGLEEGTKKYAEQQKIVNTLQDDFNAKFGVAATALAGVKREWADFIKATQPASLGLISQFLSLVEQILPRLVPIFDAFAIVAGNAFSQIGTFMASGEGERMLTFFETIGALSFDALLRVFGNLLLLFGRLFEAFGPEGVLILNALADAIGGLADKVDGMGDTQGFQDFIDYANEMGPRVLDMLGSLLQAFLAIGEALAPFAGPTLTLFTAFFDLIANAPTGVLTVLIGLFGGLFLAVQAFTAIGQMYRATVAAMGVATAIFNGILTVMRGVVLVAQAAVWLFNAAWAANPIGLIIIAIVALVAGLIYAYKHFEGFRKVVDAVVKAVVGAFKWLWDVLFGHSIIPDIVEAFRVAFNLIKEVILLPLRIVVGLVKLLFDGLVAYFKFVFNVYKTIIQTAWNIIKEIFKTGIALIKAIVRGDFGAIPGIIREAVGRILDVVRGIPGRILSALGRLGGLLKDAGKALIQGLIDGIQAMFRPLGDALGSVGGFIKDHLPGSPAKRGPLAAHGGYQMVHAGNEIVRQLISGLEDQDPNLGRALGGITDKIAATSAGISARLDGSGRMVPAGQGAGQTVIVNNPARQTVEESYETGLKRVAVRNGWVQ